MQLNTDSIELLQMKTLILHCSCRSQYLIDHFHLTLFHHCLQQSNPPVLSCRSQNLIDHFNLTLFHHCLQQSNPPCSFLQISVFDKPSSSIIISSLSTTVKSTSPLGSTPISKQRAQALFRYYRVSKKCQICK